MTLSYHEGGGDSHAGIATDFLGLGANASSCLLMTMGWHHVVPMVRKRDRDEKAAQRRVTRSTANDSESRDTCSQRPHCPLEPRIQEDHYAVINSSSTLKRERKALSRMTNVPKLPPKWQRLPRKIMQGGQAIALPVRHEDGREGVYREMRDPMSEVARARFRRELEILSRKVHHRAVVTLFDWSADSERPWYISELGGPFDQWWSQLKKALAEDPKTLIDRAVAVVVELSSALSSCHESGVIHRDIKPKNIIVQTGVAEPWPILIDFGLAHAQDGNRLTPADQAVGNARFSPDIMRNRLQEIPPWLDVFDLAQLLIWMLDDKAPKDHWQRPVHWRYAVYSHSIPENVQLSIRAFTAACSIQDTSPASGSEAIKLLQELFPSRVASTAGEIDVSSIVEAKRRGEAKKLLGEAAVQEEVESCVPLGEKIYLALRDELLSVLAEISKVEPSAKVMFDNPFHYHIIGATDLFAICVGARDHNIQLRIKTKIVPRSATPPANESNRRYWQKYMPKDAICITLALEGGVVQAYDTRFLEGRWVTIHRDGSIYLHPLNAAFGRYGNNDLGGSAEGPGVPAGMIDARDFAISVLTSEKYWEYIAAS